MGKPTRPQGGRPGPWPASPARDSDSDGRLTRDLSDSDRRCFRGPRPRRPAPAGHPAARLRTRRRRTFRARRPPPACLAGPVLGRGTQKSIYFLTGLGDCRPESAAAGAEPASSLSCGQAVTAARTAVPVMRAVINQGQPEGLPRRDVAAVDSRSAAKRVTLPGGGPYRRDSGPCRRESCPFRRDGGPCRTGAHVTAACPPASASNSSSISRHAAASCSYLRP